MPNIVLPWATVYVLMFGTFHALHRQVVKTMLNQIPPAEGIIHIWCAQVCQETRTMMEQFVRERKNAFVTFSNDNPGKYVVMRDMWHKYNNPETPWVLWLDDDVSALEPLTEWWEKAHDRLVPMIDNPGFVACAGARSKWFLVPGQLEWIHAAEWYRGKAVQERYGNRVVEYIHGPFFWIRRDLIEKLNWPDARLVHGGNGDVMLGEAIHQQNLSIVHLCDGIYLGGPKVRRGMTEDWEHGEIVRRYHDAR